MKVKTTFLVLVLCSLLSPVTEASRSYSPITEQATNPEDFNDAFYYAIKNETRDGFIDLMDLELISKKLPKPVKPYDRNSHFGGWIDDPKDNTCLNTRAKVLVRESKTPVTFNPNGCSVKSGEWEDPFSAKTFRSPMEIQVDHFVPLKNAYMTGAFEWTKNKRCLYANYLGNSIHLMPVSGFENQQKGDQTPAGYVPSNKGFVCQYLKQWLQTKAIWKLRITQKEAQGVKSQALKHHCDRSTFKMALSEIEAQRRYMDENKNYCVGAL